MQFILPLHNLLRWAVLLFGLLAVLRAIGGLSSGRIYNASDNRTGLFFMISCDLQFLIGLALFFMNGWMDRLKGVDVMKDPVTRFFTVEHAGMMIFLYTRIKYL